MIGTLTKKATAAGVDTMIVSGDLDGLQLVDDHVRLLTTRMGVAATVIYDEARVMERYGLRPDQMLDYKALKGDTSDNIPGVPGVGEKTAISLLQQFGTLDGIYEHLDEVKGKLRERLAEHRESAFMSREVGRIVTDLPVELDLDEARTGPLRPPRRGAALPRARVPLADRPAAGLEHRPDRVRQPGAGDEGRAPAQPRPARWRGAIRATGDAQAGAAARGPIRSPTRAARSSTSTRGSCAATAEMRGARRVARGPRRRGRPRLGGRHRAAAGAAALRDRAGRRRRVARWYVPCDPSSIAVERLPGWFARADRRRIGHDLKQLVTTLAADRGLELQGAFFDTLVAGYMCNPALRSQTLDDLAATRFGTELPPRPLSPETGAEERCHGAPRGRRGADRAPRPAGAASRSSSRAGWRTCSTRSRCRSLPVLARMELAGVRIDLEALAAMSDEFAATLAGLEARIYELVGHEFNIGSPKQLEQILFHELSLPATKRTRTGYSTDASVLEELRDKHEVIGLILEHRQVVEAEVDLRRRAADAWWMPTAACTRPTSRRWPPPAACRAPIRTSRTSRSAPRSAGGSAARSSRRPASCCFGADYSQQELRILAHVSGDPGLKADFAAHSDIHLAAAARVLGLAPDAGRAEGAQRREDDQLRDRLRAVATTAWPSG